MNDKSHLGLAKMGFLFFNYLYLVIFDSAI